MKIAGKADCQGVHRFSKIISMQGRLANMGRFAMTSRTAVM